MGCRGEEEDVTEGKAKKESNVRKKESRLEDGTCLLTQTIPFLSPTLQLQIVTVELPMAVPEMAQSHACS